MECQDLKSYRINLETTMNLIESQVYATQGHNLFAQTSPTLAVVFSRKPEKRSVCGVALQERRFKN